MYCFFIHIVSTCQKCSFDKVFSAQFIRTTSTIIIHPNLKNIYISIHTHGIDITTQLVKHTYKTFKTFIA